MTKFLSPFGNCMAEIGRGPLNQVRTHPEGNCHCPSGTGAYLYLGGRGYKYGLGLRTLRGIQAQSFSDQVFRAPMRLASLVF